METRVTTAPDDAAFEGYLELARHAFAKTPYGHSRLRAHGITALAVRGSEVLGGGLFLPFAQHFGGRPVPSGGVAWLTVAPWERGAGHARRLTDEGTDRLRGEHGAVLACAWTPAPGLYRRWGWEAVAVASGHTLTPADVPRPARPGTVCRPDEAARAALRDRLAPRWNGPLRRPAWWHEWKSRTLPDALTLGITREGTLAGYATFTVEPHQQWGVTAVVHELWHDRLQDLPALLDAVTARSPQVRHLRFRRSVLPRTGPLHWALDHYTVREEGWYPWVLTLLDVPRALEARGWHPHPRGALGLKVVTPEGRTTPYALTFEDGRLQARRGSPPPGRAAARTVRLPAGTLAAWYAGALPLCHAARLGTAEGDERDLALLDALAAGHQPWLPDSF